MITGDEITNGVLDKVKESFEKVETQPDSVEKYGGLDKSPATYGVVKKLRDNDMELHTDKQVQLIHTQHAFSCFSDISCIVKLNILAVYWHPTAN